MKPAFKNPFHHQLKSESGQSVILIAVVIASFVMFFGFAINTGILISAKISVQSAADAAAYAGAATQARQLNAVSYLNYDMRRQFKKFIYRYNFFGNYGSPNFPNQPAGAEYPYVRKYYNTSSTPIGSAISTPLKIPIVCIPLSGQKGASDICQLLNSPNPETEIKQFFPAGGLTAVSSAMISGVTAIGSSLNETCIQAGYMNIFTTIAWLFRADIDPSKATKNLSSIFNGIDINQGDPNSSYNQIQKSTEGLGLYARNILHLMRIETLEKFLNEPPKKNLDSDQVQSLEQSPNAESSERTIQAFKSALVNLNNEVINHSSVTMSELQNEKQITLNPILPSFNVYVQFIVPGQDPSGSLCSGRILSFKAKKAPVGVRRESGPPVHYAVKVSAKAKLLFMPSGTSELELNAVASAKPFGSRIGPRLEEKDFLKNLPPPMNPVFNTPINDCSDSETQCNIAHLPLNQTITTLHPTYLKAMRDLGTSGSTFIFKGLANAMAPNPSEVGLYNIIPPPESAQAMAFEYIPYSKDPNTSIFRFYAPLFPNSGGNVEEKVASFMDLVFGGITTGNSGPFNLDMWSLKNVLQQDIVNYVKDMSGNGSFIEFGENSTFAALQLPMGPPLSPDTYPLNPSSDKIWLTKSNEVLSSWGPENARTGSNSFGLKPRFGYSVKFVAMQNLLQSGMNSSDPDQDEVSH